jgi:cytosine/adenosine deaminase-related metal-dependent hydrolase
MNRLLLRGGIVLTMDSALGDLFRGDLLIEDDTIVAVGQHLGDVDAEIIDTSGQIVLPGMVDTHRHTWQALLRGLCADWTLVEYSMGVRQTVSPYFTADDVRLGNEVGAWEAIDAGVTTLLDFSHCINSPEHADAALDGLLTTGIRARFCYGFYAPPTAEPVFAGHEARLADFARIANRLPTGPVTLGAALTEVALIPFRETITEIRAARAQGALIAAHTGCGWGSPICTGIRELGALGLLGPEQVHIHCNSLDDQEWALLADAGAAISISPETELNMGMGRLIFDRCKQYGLTPSLSCDVVSLNSGSLIAQARLAIAFVRWTENRVANDAGEMPMQLGTRARDAVRWMTTDGATASRLDDVGSLTPGKRADVVAIGSASGFATRPILDPYGAVLFQSAPADVRLVIVDGQVRKRDGVLVGVDLPKLLGHAEDASGRILDRVAANGTVLPLPVDPNGWADFNSWAATNLAEVGTDLPAATAQRRNPR